MQSHPGPGQRTWRVQVADFFAIFAKNRESPRKRVNLDERKASHGGSSCLAISTNVSRLNNRLRPGAITPFR
jgi:hypothetical protein